MFEQKFKCTNTNAIDIQIAWQKYTAEIPLSYYEMQLADQLEYEFENRNNLEKW